MSGQRRLLVVVITAAVTVGFFALAATAAAPKPVAVSAPAPIAAYGNRVVWSQPNGVGRFELVQRVGNGPIVRLPVRTRSVPFDVDLGPTRDGRVFAVYTRCATEPTRTLWGIPEYETGNGCHIYALDLGRGREERVRNVSSPVGSEFWPTYWKGELGFARRYDDKPSAYVYVKDVASSRPSERLRGGRSFGSLDGVPLQLELYGSRLAFVWWLRDDPGDAYELRVDTVGTSQGVVLDRSRGGQTARLVGWPAFEGGRVFWARQCFGDPSGCPSRRERLAAAAYTGNGTGLAAPGPSFVVSHERAAGTTWVLRAANVGATCVSEPGQPAGTCVLDPLRPSYTPVG